MIEQDDTNAASGDALDVYGGILFKVVAIKTNEPAESADPQEAVRRLDNARDVIVRQAFIRAPLAGVPVSGG